jgi:UPF0716 protein FxsA
MGRLLLLFILIPFVELWLLIELGEIIGFWNTVAIIVGTGMVGSYLARREGMSVWQRFQQRMQTGGVPGAELMDGVIILVSGAMLLTPGVLTDVVGLLGLFPPTRALMRAYIRHRMKNQVAQGGSSFRFVQFGSGGFSATSASPFSQAPPATSPNPADPNDISNIVDAKIVSAEPKDNSA